MIRTVALCLATAAIYYTADQAGLDLKAFLLGWLAGMFVLACGVIIFGDSRVES